MITIRQIVALADGLRQRDGEPVTDTVLRMVKAHTTA